MVRREERRVPCHGGISDEPGAEDAAPVPGRGPDVDVVGAEGVAVVHEGSHEPRRPRGRGLRAVEEVVGGDEPVAAGADVRVVVVVVVAVVVVVGRLACARVLFEYTM